ncbi:hypothetical protein Q3G72_033089 [Acer saccharum]|nr:hypothetical protein Q3G72_033089 [Acer saccharum]
MHYSSVEQLWNGVQNLGSKSLQEILQSVAGRIAPRYFRCANFKLDRNILKDIVEDALPKILPKIQGLATLLKEEYRDKDFEDAPSFAHICYPGSEIPEWNGSNKLAKRNMVEVKKCGVRLMYNQRHHDKSDGSFSTGEERDETNQESTELLSWLLTNSVRDETKILFRSLISLRTDARVKITALCRLLRSISYQDEITELSSPQRSIRTCQDEITELLRSFSIDQDELTKLCTVLGSFSTFEDEFTKLLRRSFSIDQELSSLLRSIRTYQDEITELGTLLRCFSTYQDGFGEMHGYLWEITFEKRCDVKGAKQDDEAIVEDDVGGKAAVQEDVGGKAVIEEDVEEHGD